MTDESNGESSFEFVDKKLEDCDASNATAPGPVLSAPASTGNLLSNVAPPSALPTFVTSSAQNVPSTTPEAVKPPSLQLPQGVQTAEPKAVDSPTDKGPVVLIAPDSPTMDTGALAGTDRVDRNESTPIKQPQEQEPREHHHGRGVASVAVKTEGEPDITR
ncbi:uncharacterized protein LOC111643705, partial [Copidosoma floridanum]|uniref:uncharacterized protein LOC111643705 n=1 Tax=Copidosoma floridanum TaxID=29053 RepID=UPI000C6F83FF